MQIVVAAEDVKFLYITLEAVCERYRGVGK